MWTAHIYLVTTLKLELVTTFILILHDIHLVPFVKQHISHAFMVM